MRYIIYHTKPNFLTHNNFCNHMVEIKTNSTKIIKVITWHSIICWFVHTSVEQHNDQSAFQFVITLLGLLAIGQFRRGTQQNNDQSTIGKIS